MHRRFVFPAGAAASILVLLAPGARAQTPQSPPVAALPTTYQMAGPPTYYTVTPCQPRTLTWGPGPVGMTLAWTGRRLQWFDRRHTWSLGHTITRSLPARAPMTTCYATPQQPATMPLLQFAPALTPAFSPREFIATPQRKLFGATGEDAPPAPEVMLPVGGNGVMSSTQ
jgi:hypothetical protein